MAAAVVIFSSVGLCIGRMGVGVGRTGLGRVLEHRSILLVIIVLDLLCVSSSGQLTG